MPTISEVRAQIAALPHSYIFWTQKEVRALPKIMDEGEMIRGMTSGYYDGCTWLMVCTERRMFLLNCGMFYGVQQVQMPLDRIQSIDYQFTFVFGSIKIFDGINVFNLTMVSKPSIMPFVKATQEAMYNYQHHNTAAAPVTVSTTTDVASQLEKLAELKERGHLTDAEFQAQKKKLLG